MYEKDGVQYCGCFACGIGGGIYDMVEHFEGIKDFNEQVNFIERFFGSSTYIAPSSPLSSYAKKDNVKFKPDERAMQTLEEYLRKNPASENQIRRFLEERANYSTGGGTHLQEAGSITNYPDDIIPFYLDYFLYWPGLDIVRKDLSSDVFRKCGIPTKGRDNEKSAWEHSGIIMKLGTGYKLHYYQKLYCDTCKSSEVYRKALENATDADELLKIDKMLECGKYQKGGFCHRCEKRNTVGGTTFPMPFKIDETLPAIIVEGEMDALSCVAAGHKNVISAGGTSGLTGPKVKDYLLNVPEIILMYDGDDHGREASGLISLKERKSNIPMMLQRTGYAGKIKLAELSQDAGCNDPDAIILARRKDVIAAAIESAKEYVQPPPSVKEPKHKSFEFFQDLSSKRLKCLLRKIKRSALDPADAQRFITACIKAFPDEDTVNCLKSWGAVHKEIANKNDATPAFLLEIASKYLSRYLQRQIEKELTPIEELLQRIKIQKTKFKLDFDELDINENARNFAYYGGVRSAALMLADIFDGRIIYNAAKNDKRFYFFNGHTWQHEPDITGVIYNTLMLVMRHFLREAKEKDGESEAKEKEKNRLMFTLSKLESRSLRVEIQHEFAGLKAEGVYHNSDDEDDPLHFDGEAIKETLTLLDGVMDFSGKELVFRTAHPQEYRSRTLPYKVDDVKNGGECEKIWNFMRGNFRNSETLETLMYCLSIIPSRAFYKMGQFWIGGKNTGKSTTMRIMNAVYQYLICAMEPDVIVPKGKVFASSNGPTPYLAQLPGKGAAFISEPEDGAVLNAGLWKKLTGGDMVTARGLHEAPKSFRNTAQIVINTNHLPKFDANDTAVISRAVVIPFLVSHEPDEKGTMRPEEFVEYLKPEFPAFIKLLAGYYLRFKNEMKGILPVSKECEQHKMGYIAEVESDLDKYIDAFFSFEPLAVTVIQKAYEHYTAYYGYGEGSSKSEAVSRHRFTKLILKNHKDKITEQVKRVAIEGEYATKPTRCFVGVRLRSLDEVADRPVEKTIVGYEVNAKNELPLSDEGMPF